MRMQIMKQTEYLGGLYETGEIKAEAPDKAAKMTFLQKAIDAHSKYKSRQERERDTHTYAYAYAYAYTYAYAYAYACV